MNPKDFINSPSGRLVPTSIHLTPYQAFVPNSLPPTIDIKWSLVNLLGEADRAISELVGVYRYLRNPDLLIDPFQWREAVLSSAIEGTQTTVSDLLAYQLRESPYAVLGNSSEFNKDNQEVNNYVKALRWGVQSIENHRIDEKLLLGLHEKLLSGVRGEEGTPGRMREEQNFIGPGRNPDVAIYIPPPVPEMNVCIRDFFRYLSITPANDYPPLIRLGILHYQFEAIHPFRDGNGRIGRLLLVLILIQWGLIPAPLLYISAAFAKQRRNYYDLLLNVSQKGEWEQWLTFFLAGVKEQSQYALSRGNALISLREGWRKRLVDNKKRSKTAQKLCEELFIMPLFTIPKMQKRLGFKNYHSVEGAVAELIEEGIIKPVNEAKYERNYIASQILDIVA
jgi:Fic family protein